MSLVVWLWLLNLVSVSEKRADYLRRTNTSVSFTEIDSQNLNIL